MRKKLKQPLKTDRQEHLIDASGKVLGRLAVEIGNLLRGKNKPNFRPYLDQGDFVTVINTDKIRLTGKKFEQKKYFSHSGYPGGLKIRKFEEIFKRDSRKALREAVYGMLPKNKLRDKMIKRLKMYPGATTEVVAPGIKKK